MYLGIEPAAEASDSLRHTVFGTIGILVDLAVCAVFKNHFDILSKHQLLVKPIGESAQREPVEVLIDRRPTAELIGSARHAQPLRRGYHRALRCSSSAALRQPLGTASLLVARHSLI
jgi:hypothetical protein